MSYDPYDAPPRERTSKRYYHEERRDDRDPRYLETRDNYLTVSSRDLVPRSREDSDLSVEEIHRDFPPPGYASRDIHRSRSAGGGYYDGYEHRRSHHDRDYDEPRSSRKTESYYYEEEHKKKARMVSKQEQIIAAITGAAIAIGGKELYDRRDAKQHETDVQRNVLASAALGAAGALAGYSGTEAYNKLREREGRKAAHKSRDYYSDEEEGSKEKKGNKNFLEGALAAAGLGGAVKALTGGLGKDDKSDTKSRGGRSRSSSTSRSKKGDGKGEGANKIQKAAMASLIAGATEAFRVSKEPGGWKGEKAKRILTAAAGAATIDAAQKGDKGGSKLGLAESVIGGLIGNRVINGSKRNIEEDEKTGRSRSRSRARSKSRDGGGGGVSGLAALATAGLGAFGAKKIMDNRERSQSRGRDSDDGSPKRHRSRSRSVVDKARRGIAKLGIGNGPDDDESDRDRDHDRDRRRDRDRDRHRHDDDSDYDDKRGSRRHRDSHDDYDRSDRDRKRRDDYDDDRSRHGRDHDRDRGTVARRGSASSTDLGDSDEDEKRGKKMRGKQILTTGLATVATIHAAASVYQSMEKRKKRQKAVREGRLSPEDAKKLKTKALLQDAASVGIAALGIKGAISELKEAHEIQQEIKEWREQKEIRHNRRLSRLRGSSSRGHDSSSDDGGGVGSSEYGYGRHRADNWYSAAPPKLNRYDDGPRYNDGNPYAALPPPDGQSDRR